MAHECLECGQACYCDLDDTWMECPADCHHDCEPEPDPYDEEDVEDDDALVTPPRSSDREGTP